MTAHPPRDLSRHVTAVSILAAAGINVKNLTPQVSTCPFCKTTGSLSIYSDPIIAGTSRWLHCSSCRFSGDTIEAYGRLKVAEDVQRAAQWAIRDGHFDGPVSETSPSAIEQYALSYPLKRKKIAEYWEQLTDPMLSFTPDMLRRAGTEAYLIKGRGQSQELMRRFLGGGTRQDICKIFGNHLLPTEGFTSSLALNFQDVPGRTCAFQFIGTNDNVYVKNFSNQTGDREGGLAMLDTLNALEGTVYAVNDRKLALHMHAINFHDWSNPIKLLLYNGSTKNAWKSVSAERVIFMAYELDENVFLQARRVENGYITTKPQPRVRDIKDYFRDTSVSAVLSAMERYAQPWQKVLLGVLLDKNTEYHTLRALVNNLELSSHERDQLMQQCSRREQDTLKDLFETTKPFKTREDGKYRHVDKGDGWYRVHPGGREEKITDARIVVRRELLDSVTVKAFWEGEVIFRGKEVPFVEDVDIMKADVGAWLTRLLIKSGLGTPMVKEQNNEVMMNNAREFSNYDSTFASRQIGIVPSGDIVFPQFLISGGKVNKDNPFLLTSDMPAQNVKAHNNYPKRFYDGYAYSFLHSIFIALGCAYITNLLAKYTNDSVKPIGIIGERGSTGRDTMKAFAELAGITQYDLTSASSKLLESIRENGDKYGYPCYIDPVRPGLLGDYPPDNSDHLFIGLTALEGTALSVGGNWIFINVTKSELSGAKLPNFAEILIYMTDLQKRDYNLPDEESLIQSVVKDFTSWYEIAVRQAVPELKADLATLIRRSGRKGDELMRLSVQLFRTGKLSIGHEAIGNAELIAKKYAIVIDDEAEQVFISRPGLLEAVRKAKLPLSSLREANADLSQRKLLLGGEKQDGWILPKKAWENSATGCLG
jgi:hypothetical protein